MTWVNIKFASLNNLGIQGHVEDVVVAADQRGKHFGIYLIQAVDYIGKKLECYKVRSTKAG